MDGNILDGVPAADPTLTLSFSTHEQAGGAGSGSSMPLKTYDLSGLACDLEILTTKTCNQQFEIYAKSYTGIVGKVADISVTFKKECFQIFETGTGLPTGADLANLVDDYWTW